MAAVIPDNALVNLLQQALDAADSVTLRLFSDTITPSPTIGLGAFTECTFSGYAPVVLTPSVALDTSEDGVATTQTFDVSFVHDGGSATGTVVGWYMTMDSGTTSLMGPFQVDEDGPFPMVNLGDGYDVDVSVLAVQE